MRINDKNLFDDFPYDESPNKKGKIIPDTIIIHYTASDDFQATVKWLRNPAAKASAHLVVGRDGAVTQLVAFDERAWHAGISEYTFADGSVRKNFNNCSVGIEIVNAGGLKKSGEKYFSWYKKEIPENEVLFARHRNQDKPAYWHKYPEVQVRVVEEICIALIAKYQIKYILGHEEIAPGRKIDPGPAFPLDELRGKLLSGALPQREEQIPLNKGIVNTARLNIRDSAGGKIIAKPLTQNTVVQILESSKGWYKVSVPLEGWVAAEYITNLNRGQVS